MSKVLDITPPEKSEHKEPEPEQEEFWSMRKIILLAVVVVAGIAVFSFFNFAKAEIKIWPRTEKIETEELITVKKSATTVADGTIPGEMISTQVEGSRQFEAEKIDKKQKAQGKVRIYNDATRNITLVNESQLMSASQQVYLLDKRITIPAAQWGGGDKEPGHVDMTVTAAEAGEDYNVEETKFSFPKLNGTQLYHQIYAETITPINGGLDGEAYQVTEQGVKEAKEDLRSDLKERGEERLREKNYNIIPDTFTQNATDTFISAQPGMKTEKFTVQEEVNTEAFAFKQESLRKIAERLAQEKIKGGKINEPSLNIDYEVSEVYPEQGRALINVKISAKVHAAVDEEGLKGEVRGMSLTDLYSWLGQKKSIAETEITTWPQWMRSLPSDQDRVNIEVIIE